MPALAQSWTTRDGGRSWNFTLRPSASFWDGSDVRPADIVDNLILRPGIRSAHETGERELTVSLDTPSVAVPRAFADPALAISRVTTGWPVGTGAYRPVSQGADTLRAEWGHSGGAAPGWPESLVFRWAAGARARDLLDAGVEAMITGDAAIRQYARARGGYAEVALPWDRTYLLFVPAAADAPTPSEIPGPGFLEAIAREAVSGDARAVTKGAWQEETGGSAGAARSGAPAAARGLPGQ